MRPTQVGAFLFDKNLKSMENNLENKAAFLAQYWGQRNVKCNTTWFPGSFGYEYGNNLGEDVYETDYLKLKSISQITDEDTLNCVHIPLGWEVFKVYSIKNYEYCEVTIRSKCNKDEISLNEDGYKYKPLFPNFYNSEATDYLRSKGYAFTIQRRVC